MGRRDIGISELDGMVAEFAMELRREKQKAGNPTYNAMARKTGFTGPSLSGAARGLKPPTWAVTEAYLAACGVAGEATLRMWRLRLSDVRQWYAEQQIVVSRAGKATRRTLPQRRAAVSAYVAPRAGITGTGDQLLVPGEVRQMLLKLKNGSTMSYRQIAAQSRSNEHDPYLLTCSTTQEVLTGKRLPPKGFVESFLMAVGATVGQRDQVMAQLQVEDAVREASALMKGAITVQRIVVTDPAADHVEGGIQELLVTTGSEHAVTSLIVHRPQNVAGPKVTVGTAVTASKPKPGRHRAETQGRILKMVNAARLRFALTFGDLSEAARAQT